MRKEIVEVHRSLAEQAFRQQAEVILADGQLTKAMIEQLNEAQKQVGRPPEYAQKGEFFKQTMDEIFSSGTGDFDEEEVYEKIPKIDPKKAKAAIGQLIDPSSCIAEAKKSGWGGMLSMTCYLWNEAYLGTLIVPLFTLNNLLACDKAVPAMQLSWDMPEELADLFAICMKSDPAPEKLARLQYLLGINDSTPAALREMGDRFQAVVAEEEEYVF
ncbi:hypothetical protein Ancab_011697 [Ancistrocladus abbreviatus]